MFGFKHCFRYHYSRLSSDLSNPYFSTMLSVNINPYVLAKTLLSHSLFLFSQFFHKKHAHNFLVKLQSIFRELYHPLLTKLQIITILEGRDWDSFLIHVSFFWRNHFFWTQFPYLNTILKTLKCFIFDILSSINI